MSSNAVIVYAISAILRYTQKLMLFISNNAKKEIEAQI